MDYTEPAKYKLSNSETFFRIYDSLEFMKWYQEAFKTIFWQIIKYTIYYLYWGLKTKDNYIWRVQGLQYKASFFVSFPVFYRF